MPDRNEFEKLKATIIDLEHEMSVLRRARVFLSDQAMYMLSIQIFIK
jgi:hypothetical protein